MSDWEERRSDWDVLHEERRKRRQGKRDSLARQVDKYKLQGRAKIINGGGTMIVDGKYIYHCQSKKARVKGRSEHYKMRGFNHFYDTFLKEPEPVTPADHFFASLRQYEVSPPSRAGWYFYKLKGWLLTVQKRKDEVYVSTANPAEQGHSVGEAVRVLRDAASKYSVGLSLSLSLRSLEPESP